ncbi:DnaJ domain [Lasallia pustulata]|uniref:DnaJ domain n=1 Tax=Lasallia pustulata TaxID=136370 RepID=A0A1W5CXR3_9LECA|nr:DnaJ domain [Lasallia pustulata]
MSTSGILSYIGWTFLPNLVTGWLQSLYYGITIRAGDPKPQPGTPLWLKHRRRIHMTVVLAYLLYTVVEADYEVLRDGDFYQDLGLPHNVDDKGIKSRFRRLAAIHHPDKISTSGDDPPSEVVFMQLKAAQDTLLNPTKRFAYDRFGPDILYWQHCDSIREYVLAGLKVAAPLYLGSAIFMALLGLTGYLQWGRFWRYLAFGSLVLLEIHTITRPYSPAFLTVLLNPLLQKYTLHPPILPFQMLVLARRAALTLFIALAQLGHLFQPSVAGPVSSSNAQQQQQLLKLEQLASHNETEASRLLALDMAPFVGDDGAVKDLRSKIREWLVQNTIRADPEVRDAMGRAMGRRRIGAPVGARGTR